MAFKYKGTTAGYQTKFYFVCANPDNASGSREWEYVTTDVATAVDGTGYITEQSLIDNLQVGDRVWVYTLTALDDTRTLIADKAAASNLLGVSLHIVVSNNGTTVDLSNTIFASGGTLTDAD